MKYEIFLDADGVLYNFDKRVNEMGFTERPLKGDFWKYVAKSSKEGVELWGAMELYPGALDLVHFSKRYRGSILTATGRTGNALKEKAKRFQEDFGNFPAIFVTSSEDKARFAAPNRILIDDRSKSIDPWIAAGGIGILHTTVEDTMIHLESILGTWQQVE